MTTTTENIEVKHLEGLEAARLLEKCVLLSIEQRQLASAFFFLTKLQSFVLSFLLVSTASDPNYQVGVERDEYLSMLARLDRAISEVIS